MLYIFNSIFFINKYMICNIDYIDPTNDQFILRQVPLNTKEPSILTEKSVIKMMLNDFSLSSKLETFCNHDNKNYYIYIIILFILFILFYNSI
jgi:hypothetical protein